MYFTPHGASKRGASPSFFSSPLSFQGEGDTGGEVDPQNNTIKSKLPLCSNMCYTYPCMTQRKKDNTKVDKPLTDLKTFIENVNKKDKLSGKRIRFAFVNKKRKH